MPSEHQIEDAVTAAPSIGEYDPSSSSFSENTIRVACRVPSETFYLNNVETDVRFINWTTDVKKIQNYGNRRPFMPGSGSGRGFPAIRRNLLVLTTYINLAAGESQQTIA